MCLDSVCVVVFVHLRSQERYTEECSGGDSDGWSVASFTSCGSYVVVVLDWKITAHAQWKCGKWKESIN